MHETGFCAEGIRLSRTVARMMKHYPYPFQSPAGVFWEDQTP